MINNATVLISENILQATADAIRNKGGASGSIKPTDFAETIKAIATGGLDTSDATATAAEILSGETAYVNGRKLVGTMPNNGAIFSTMDGIEVKSVSIPSGYTSGGTVSLTNDIDNEVGTQADLIERIAAALENKATGGGELVEYSENEKAVLEGTLSTYTNDKIEKLRNYAFYDNPNLTSVNLPAVSTIGAYAFRGCSNLTTAIFPAATNIKAYAFDGCDKLTSISFPVASSIATGAFSVCRALISVTFPAATETGIEAFRYCMKLTTAIFPKASRVSNGAFIQCNKLASLRLGSNSVCQLTQSTALQATPFAGYTYSGTPPHIYVPASLVSAYQSATNWVYFSSYFSAIESLEV